MSQNIQNPISKEVLTSLFTMHDDDSLRLVNRESSTVEFKESFSMQNKFKYLKTMAAFANNKGGYLVFGVKDKPRELLGLSGRSFERFDELSSEKLTVLLNSYFSPEIQLEHCVFELKGKKLGIIYVYPCANKPCICKISEGQEVDDASKCILKEGDIYYRYGARSERIKYGELFAIIDESRRNEEHQWLSFIQKTAQIGVTNAAILSLKDGKIIGKNGSILIDNDLLKDLVFIQEGSFVERDGAPAIRLVGEIKNLPASKVVLKTTKVVKALEENDIITSFLENQQVENPVDYVKVICSKSSAYLPVYFFIQQSQLSISGVLEIVEQTFSRGKAKQNLIPRLNGKIIQQQSISDNAKAAGKTKQEYVTRWLNESIPPQIDNLKYCLDAILCLTDDEIKVHKVYICSTMLRIYKAMYESASPQTATSMRKAICRIDEALYLKNCKDL